MTGFCALLPSNRGYGDRPGGYGDRPAIAITNGLAHCQTRNVRALIKGDYGRVTATARAAPRRVPGARPRQAPWRGVTRMITIPANGRIAKRNARSGRDDL